jgi:hypothetical protein
LKQVAPGRVDGDGETWIIISRTDANPTASAWFDPANSAVHAVSEPGNEG